MAITKAQIRRCFNRAKTTYDQHCQLQMDTGHELMAAINSWKINSRNTLDLGCGTGRITQILAGTEPHRRLMGIDMADDLLKIARSRLGESTPVFCADFDKIPAQDHQFDLVFSNMALQWSLDFAVTLMEITRVIQQNGCLAFTLPADGTFTQIKKLLYQLTGKSYLNEFMPLHWIQKTLKNGGYQIVDYKIQEYNLSFLNLSAAFHSLKKVGAMVNNSIEPLAKSIYRKTFTPGVILDYRIATVIARQTCL